MQYFKEYFADGKFIGTQVCYKDREILGYAGRRTDIADAPIKIGKKIIKPGTQYRTILYPLCDKLMK
jgi:hypothetical protein